MSLHTCTAPNCGRSFLDQARLSDHAEAVHTFDDIRAMVCEELREEYIGTDPDGDGDAIRDLWIVDIAADWVVFQAIEGTNGGDYELYKVGYAIDADNNVTFAGDPVEVIRRTVYDVAPPETDAEPEDQQNAGPTQWVLVPADGAASATKAPDAGMAAAEKALSASQFATYKKMRAKGMAHAMALAAAKKAS